MRRPCPKGPARGGGRGAHLQLAGAAVLDERRESCQLQLGVRLQLVPHQVGHLGHVVAQVLAHGDADGVAAPLLLVPEAPCWPQEQQQQQQQPQTETDAPGLPQDARPCAPPGHGQSRGQRRRGLLQQTPPVCTGAPAARAAPSSGKGRVIRRQGRRGGSGRLSQLRATVRGIRHLAPGPKDRLRGSWLQKASPQTRCGPRPLCVCKARQHPAPRRSLR